MANSSRQASQQTDDLRRPAIAAAVLVACVFSSRMLPAADPPLQPNIVLIMADDLGYAHLGCYGQQRIATPRLDRMAAEGLRFTDFYAGCCVCAPSRSVLMTGLHGGHTAVRGNSGGIALAAGDVTVAEVLKQAGYATGLFGKWGLGEHGTTGVPYRQGFDEFFGYLHQIHAHFYYPEYLWANDRKVPLAGNADGARGQYTHDEIVARALDFLRRHQRERFFLYVPFAVPHYELLVPEESLQQYAGRFPETPYTGRGRPTGYPHDYAAQPMPRAATAAIVSHMDRSIGKLLDQLAELDLDSETLVLFTSDNGATPGASDPDFFAACGPLRGYKGTLYEGGLRVPLIARWPGHVPAGAVSEHAGYFADLLSTFAELGGGNAPAPIDGISIVPTLLGADDAGAQRQHEYLYWEDDEARAVRSGRYKAIRARTDAPVELYDLKADPSEQHDLAEQQPDIAARLSRFLDEGHTPPRPQIEPARVPGRQFY